VGGSAPRRWIRVALITLLVLVALVAVAAGGVYLWLDYTLRQGNQDPDASAISSALSLTTSTWAGDGDPVPDNPDAQDILVLGSDTREGEGDTYGRSDTLMIIHVDPSEDYVSILSLPRDLRVEIPEHGVQKINAAFAYGGPVLAIETVQWVTGLDLDHYVNIDFEAFRALTTSLGGIYVDVDRRYYYGGDQYENIDIQPGYQRLAGEQALDYVRFRHDNNADFGRIERQQRFLTAARDQVSKWETAIKVPQLVSLVARNVSTDIDTAPALQLAVWGLRLDRARIRQVTLAAETREIGGVSYVVATDEAMREAVRDLKTAPARPLPDDTSTTGTTEGSTSTGTTGGTGSSTAPSLFEKVDLTGVTVNVFNGNGRSGEAGAAGAWLESMGAVIGRIGDAASSENARSMVLYPPEKMGAAQLVARATGVSKVLEDSAGGEIALVLGRDFVLPEGYRPVPTLESIPDSGTWDRLTSEVSFGLMAPSLIPEDFKYRDSRSYEIDTEDGAFPALKVMYRLGREDQYLGLMETTFVEAPAAADGEVVAQNGIDFTVVATAGQVDRVWWKRDGVLYWVSNTLSYHLDRAEMLAFAQSAIPLP